MSTKRPCKECSVCHAVLPIGMFYVSGGDRLGRRPECKTCTRARRKGAKAIRAETMRASGIRVVLYHSFIIVDMTPDAIAERTARAKVYAAQVARGNRITWFPRKVG